MTNFIETRAGSKGKDGAIYERCNGGIIFHILEIPLY